MIAKTKDGRTRVTLYLSTMGEPFLDWEGVCRLVPDASLDPDKRQYQAAGMLAGYEFKGHATCGAYLRRAGQ